MNEQLVSAEMRPPLEAVPKNKKWEFKTHDAVFALVFYALGYMYIELSSAIMGRGIGGALFVGLYIAAVLLYLKCKNKTPARESWFWLLVLILTGISRGLYGNYQFGALNFLFLHAAAVYWTMSATNALIYSKTSSSFLYDGFRGFFILPFIRFPAQYVAMAAVSKNYATKKDTSTFKSVLIGLAMCIPLLFIIVPLLAKADPLFNSLIGTLHIDFTFLDNGISLILALPVSAYLFSLVYAALNVNKPDKEHISGYKTSFRILNNASVRVVLIVMLVVYTVFLTSVTFTLIQAVSGQMPSGTTYSSFAREGFFELCRVAALTLLIIAFCICSSKTKWNDNKSLRLLTQGVCVAGILLVITAIAKMFLYISAYGLTPLRFFTSAFMLFMLLVYSLIVVRAYKSFCVCRVALCSFCLGFSMLLCANVSNIITQYNVTGYLNGSLKSLNVQSFLQYNHDDIYALQRLYSDITHEGDKKILGEYIERQSQSLLKYSSAMNCTVTQLAAQNIKLSS